MTINEFMNGLPNEPVKAMMGDQVSIWSNDACKGYCLAAMQSAGLNTEQIATILSELRTAFDQLTVDEAEKVTL